MVERLKKGEFELEVKVYDEIGSELIARRPGMRDPNPTEEQANCEHEKVYSSSVLCSYPASYPWICSKCGLEGLDRGSLPQGETYDDVRKRFNK